MILTSCYFLRPWLRLFFFKWGSEGALGGILLCWILVIFSSNILFSRSISVKRSLLLNKRLPSKIWSFFPLMYRWWCLGTLMVSSEARASCNFLRWISRSCWAHFLANNLLLWGIARCIFIINFLFKSSTSKTSVISLAGTPSLVWLPSRLPSSIFSLLQSIHQTRLPTSHPIHASSSSSTSWNRSPNSLIFLGFSESVSSLCLWSQVWCKLSQSGTFI